MGLMTTTTSSATDSGAAGTSSPGALPPHLQKLMAKVTEISSLPEITARIVEVVEDPRATAHDMHEIVKNDPALAAKILKVVNSAFYGLPAQIASLDRAIVMLGLSAVKNIALAASLARLFTPGTISEHFSARDLWRHCIAVGVCGRMLTKAASGIHNDEAFVAGLVHDMGLLIEYQVFGKELRDVVNASYADGRDFCALETQIIGADHQAFGAALAAKWKFPPVLRSVISHHHTPQLLRAEYQKVVTLIYVADTLCCQQQMGFWLTARDQRIDEDLYDSLGVTRETVEEIIEQLPANVEEAEQVFSDN